MSEKLELKDIVGYFPYGLKAVKNGVDLRVGLGVIDYWDGSGNKDEEISISNTEVGYYLSGIENCKPILRPMSDLVKPLPDGTIPIVEMWSRNLFGYNSDKKPIPSEFMCEWTLSDLMENISFDNYSRLFEYLYAHHFDINNLIGRGLAIDTNTTKIKNK